MAIEFKNYQYLADNFNRKYGTSFRYEDFENEVIRKKELDDGYGADGPNISEENQQYISDFITLFDKAFTNSVDKKIESFIARDFIEDYNNMMAGYRDARKDSGVPFTQNWAFPKTSKNTV